MLFTCLVAVGYAAAAVYTDLLETDLPDYILEIPSDSCLNDARRRNIPSKLALQACGCMVDRLKDTYGLGEMSRLILTAVTGSDWTRENDDFDSFANWSEWADSVGQDCLNELL